LRFIWLTIIAGELELTIEFELNMKVLQAYHYIILSFTLVLAMFCFACAQQPSSSEQTPSTSPETKPIPHSATLEMTADTFFEQGLASAGSGQYEQAIRDLTGALEIDPTYAEAYYLRGCAYLGMQVYDMAITDMEKATALGITVQDIPGLKDILNAIVPPGGVVLLDITCTSEGGIDCQGKPKPYTNTLHLQLFANPGESGIEVDTIYISPAIGTKSQMNSPIRYFNNTGIEHLVICISTTEPPTTPPTCSVDYKPKDELSSKKSNTITCAEIEVGRLICPTQFK
jgi:hypothetical protein